MSVGTLYIVSAPSGAGKTSLLKEVRARLPNLAVAVSHTTRDSRPGEVNGEHYLFVSTDEFKQKIEDQDFLEYAAVFGNFYGTSKQAVNSLLERGQDVVLEIDWQGARQVREVYADAVSIFILPPSVEELEARLRSRAQDAEETIARRMQEAKDELSHYDEYQHLIINEDFTQAVDKLVKLFTNENIKAPDEAQITRILSAL